MKAAQVAIVAYTEDGQMKEGQGVFIDENGTLITEYDFLKGAVRAHVVDFTGKEYEVAEVAGANAMYNVAKLIVTTGKGKTSFIPTAASATQDGSVVYILTNVKADKNSLCTTDTIIKTETFKGQFRYYTLSNAVSNRQATSPTLNEKGEMIGLVQMPAKGGASAFVIDAAYASSLKVTALDAGNNDLGAIRIRKALPEKEEDAATFVFLTSQRDKKLYAQYVEDFILKFPSSTSGYIMKAEQHAQEGRYAESKAVYERAATDEKLRQDEIAYSMSKCIYTLNLSPSYTLFEDWNLDKALTLAQRAYELNPLPVYTSHEGDCLFALKKYNEAADKFLSLAQTNMRSPEVFLYAAQCRRMGGAKNEDILALLDSAIALYPTPLPQVAADVVILRAKTLSDMEKYKEAVAGYNEFEHLRSNSLTENFYYEREQLEIKCRMYPQALNDIDKAIRLSPREPILYAEAAALNYRLNQIDEAITHAHKAIELDDHFPDAYRILGVCYNQKGNKADARKFLQKAIENEDTLAKGILEKMGEK